LPSCAPTEPTPAEVFAAALCSAAQTK
jgi:hypothetical protein